MGKHRKVQESVGKCGKAQESAGKCGKVQESVGRILNLNSDWTSFHLSDLLTPHITGNVQEVKESAGSEGKCGKVQKVQESAGSEGKCRQVQEVQEVKEVKDP